MDTYLHAHHEQYHAHDTEETANIINLTKNLTPGEALRVDAWGREVEEESKEESDGGPYTTDEPDVSPTRVIRNKLPPEH